MAEISEAEFAQFQRFIYEAAGITLSVGKKALVCGRLGKRLHACQVRSFGEYFELLMSGESAVELQNAVDLLTTNETYFFREPKHFERLRAEAAAAPAGAPFRVWSAAGSTGEEAYSIAMVLEDVRPGRLWEVFASDISARVLSQARVGHYRADRLQNFPPGYLQRFCLRGCGPQEGTVLVERWLRERVRFMQVNLNERLPQMGLFEVVFLRNVLIYFNRETKRQVVARVLEKLRPGGLLFIGHSESLADVTQEAATLAPSVFRKPR